MESFEVREPSSFGSLSRDFYLANLLIDEVIAENMAAVKLLLESKKARVDTVVPERGAAALHLLAGMENEDFSTTVTLQALLRTGADPNVRSEEGLTPVHVAATYGRCKVLEVLLTNGGDPSLLDYRLLLDAEGHAMRQQQWRAYFVLTTYAAIVEDPDRFAKYLDEGWSIPRVEHQTASEKTLVTTEAEESPTQRFEQSKQQLEDYDWLNSEFELNSLDDNSIKMIKNHREQTTVYQYPNEDAEQDSLSGYHGSERSDQLCPTPRTHVYAKNLDEGCLSSSRLLQKTGKESASTYQKDSIKGSSRSSFEYPSLETKKDGSTFSKYSRLGSDKENSSFFKYPRDTDSLRSFKMKLCKIISSKQGGMLSKKDSKVKEDKSGYQLKKVNSSINIPTISQGSLSSRKCSKNLEKSEKGQPKKDRSMSQSSWPNKKRRESEMYYCEFAEQQVFSKRSQSRSSSYCPEDDSFFSKVPSNRMLCKMSRIFLFMLRKRNTSHETKISSQSQDI